MPQRLEGGCTQAAGQGAWSVEQCGHLVVVQLGRQVQQLKLVVRPPLLGSLRLVQLLARPAPFLLPARAEAAA